MKMNYEMNPLFKCMKLFLIYASLFSILFLNKYFLEIGYNVSSSQVVHHLDIYIIIILIIMGKLYKV